MIQRYFKKTFVNSTMGKFEILYNVFVIIYKSPIIFNFAIDKLTQTIDTLHIFLVSTP